MDHNSKILTIAVVAIVLIAGIGSAIYLLTGSNSGEKRINTTEKALVYGNANNDYAIDQLDIDFIQDIVDKKTTWNKTANPFADADNDGTITSKDVELVKKIINDEPCNVYYYNHFGESQEISYPQKDKRIAVTYWQQAEEMAILGVWDNVYVANASVMTKTNLYDLSHVTSIGKSSGSALDAAQVETILENKIDLIIGSAYDTVRQYADPLKSKGVETIYLWHAGDYCLSTILTLGVLMDEEEAAEKFLKYWVNIQEMLNDRLPAEKDRPSIVITMMHADEDRYIGSYGGIFTSVNDPAGEWILIKNLGNVYTTEVTGNKTLGRNFYQPEWFIEHAFDYMVIMGSGTGATNQDEYNAWFEGMVDKYYSKTQEYADGNLLGVTYAFGGFSGYSLMGVLAWMIYPDLFTHEEAVDIMQEFYDDFTDKRIDCTTLPQYYLGTGYDASYL